MQENSAYNGKRNKNASAKKGLTKEGEVGIIVNVVARGASESERLNGDGAILENDIEK